MRSALILASCAVLLSSCGETNQNKSSGNTNRGDAAPWQGANNVHVVKGWTPGNQGTWENQVRNRGQLQNEYMKVN